MRFVIRGKNIEVTEAINNRIEKQFLKLKKYKLLNDTCTIHIDVRTYRENLSKIVIVINVPSRRRMLKAKMKHYDLYTAIDAAYDKIEKQIQKIKEKRSPRNNEKFSEITNEEEINTMDEDI